MKQDPIDVSVDVHDPLCNPLPNTSVTLYIRVPFLLLFFSLRSHTSSLIVQLAFSLSYLFDTFCFFLTLTLLCSCLWPMPGYQLNHPLPIRR